MVPMVKDEDGEAGCDCQASEHEGVLCDEDAETPWTASYLIPSWQVASDEESTWMI
jgi:hypothetical protein